MERRINIKNRDRVTNSSSGIELAKVSSHWIFKVVVLVVVGVILYSVYNSAMITIQKLNILKRAEQEVQDLRLTNLHLSISIKDMSTDRYLEKEARDRLNFGGEGEVIFVIPENSLNIAQTQVQKLMEEKEEGVYNEGSNLYKWVEFVIQGV